MPQAFALSFQESVRLSVCPFARTVLFLKCRVLVTLLVIASL